MLEVIKNLQKELSLFLICIAISTVIIVISLSKWQSSFEHKQQASKQLMQAKTRYYMALDRKRLLKEFEQKFKNLETAGIFGDENRLNWVDVIEDTTRKFKIPYLRYKIDKRKSATSSALKSNYPGIDIYTSAMSLEMHLLHEGDLYSVINTLDQKAQGLFDIQHCSIVRNTTQGDSLLDSSTDKNFAAYCQLNWYTFKKKTPVKPQRHQSS